MQGCGMTDNRTYYRARAEQELEAAGAATDMAAAAAHASLAKLFMQKAGAVAEQEDLSSRPSGRVADYAGDAGNFRQIPRSGRV